MDRTNVRKIPQPVKIAQLLGPSGRPRNGQGNSVNKISLPERITPYLKSISNKKKNEKNRPIRLPHNERNVRRNLNFTRTPTTVARIKKLAKENRNNSNDKQKEKTFCLSTRRSFLLPPNTIKDLHVKNRVKQNRSVLPRSCILTVDSKNKYPRISEGLESCLPPLRDKNVYIDSVIHEKSKKISVIQHMLPQTFNINDQSGINILHSPHLDLMNTTNETGERFPESLNFDKILDTYSNQNNGYNITTNRLQLSSAHNMNTAVNTDLHNSNDTAQNNPCCADRYSFTTCVLSGTEKIKEACSVNVEKKKCLSTTKNNCTDLHSSLLSIMELDNLQRNTNEDDKYISLSKTELTALIFKLKHLVCRLEEDLSNMKLTLTTVTNVLSAINVTNKETNNETKIEQQMVESLNNDTEIIKSTSIKSPLCTTISGAINTESDSVMKDTYKTLDINLSKFSQADSTGRNNSVIQSSREIALASASNKENEILNTPNNIRQCEKPKSKIRRRSARLIEKALNNLNTTNDSFMDLENKLDIVNIKCNTTIESLKNKNIPMSNECKDKKVRKSLKEYMVLKSSMSCLLTPNIKRFNSLTSEDDTHPKSGDTKASLSVKILENLYNLYEDSVDTE